MIKKAGIGKRVLSLFLTLVLSVSLIQMSALAEGTLTGSDVTGKLENFSLAVTQEGRGITSGEAIDTGKAFEIKGAFDSIALDGIQTGDYATIAFPEWLQFTGSTVAEMKAEGLKVADVTFDKNVATIRFDLTRIPEGALEITNAWFNASMKYVGTDGKDDGSDRSFTILDKTYTYKFDHVVQYNIRKSGDLNDTKDAVNWTITASAKYSDGTPAPLAGAAITDDLSALEKEGQDLSSIKNSVVVKDSAGKDISDQAEVKIDNGVLTCTFKEGATAASAVISFATPFDKSKAYATGEAEVSNSATLSKDGKETSSNPAKVSYKPTWIEKSLEGQYRDAACQTKSDSGLYYRWTITVNPDSCDLKDAKIVEKLPSALELVNATSDNGKSWNPLPTGSVFELGDITGKVTLTIVTKVKDAYIYNGIPNRAISAGDLQNSADFSWKGSGTFSAGPVTPGSGIGFTPITKQGTYTAADQTVTWTVTVPKMSLSYETGLRVLDLVAMEKGFDRISVTDSNWGEIAKGLPLPTSGMEYVGNSATSADGLTLTPVPLTDGAGKKATLLVATGFPAAGTGGLKDNYTFTYQTKITDPNIYAGNAQKVTNTAALYDGDHQIQTGSATITAGNMLMKDVLPLAKAQELETAVESGADVSGVLKNISVDDKNSFNYQDHTAYFRILINADDLNFNAATGKTFSFTDALPAGWTFEKIGGADFLLCQGEFKDGGIQSTKQLSGSEIADLTETAFASDKNGNSMTLQFKTLAQPYVLVIKAKMDDATFKDLYSGKGSSGTFRNKVTASSDAYTTPPDDDEDVILKAPDILTKALNSGSAAQTGELTWTVEYHAYGISRGTAGGTITNTITDTLPAGIDLRTDSVGNLIYGGNITLVKLVMNADGNYSAGDAITGDALARMVTYSMKDRILTLTLPDNTNDSYRLTYVTDVTGAARTEIQNTVALNSETQNASGVQAGYQITAAAAGATLRFGGRLSIEKTGANGAKLPGAEFALVNEKNITVRTATTDGAGMAVLKAIPSGRYTLRETAAPAGYLPAADRSVTVASDGTVQVGGAVLSGALNIADVLTDSASLTVSKRVTGNAVSAGDLTKQFTFHIVLSGGKTAVYTYTAENMNGGDLSFDGGKATVALTSGQSLTLWNLPVGETYTVTEQSNSGDGFVTSVNGLYGTTGSGALERGVTAAAVFVNSKNAPHYPEGPAAPTTPGTEIPDSPTPTAPTVPTTPTVPDTEIPNTNPPMAGTPDGHSPKGGNTVSVPKTGDEMILWAELAVGSAAGLGILFLCRRRRNRREA